MNISASYYSAIAVRGRKNGRRNRGRKKSGKSRRSRKNKGRRKNRRGIRLSKNRENRKNFTSYVFFLRSRFGFPMMGSRLAGRRNCVIIL